MEFTVNEAVDAAVERAMQHAKTFTRGHLIHHETLEQLFQCQRYEGIWSRAVRKFIKRFLAETGIEIGQLPNDHAVGYRLFTRDDQLTYSPQRRAKKATRQFTRSIKSVESMPTTGLSVRQMSLRDMRSRQLRAARVAIKRQMRDQQNQFRPSYVSPRLPKAG